MSKQLEDRFGITSTDPGYILFSQSLESQEQERFYTYGSGRNEAQTSYKYRGGSHDITIFDLFSPDVLVVFQAEMVGFYKKLRSSDKIEPVKRSVKQQLLGV